MEAEMRQKESIKVTKWIAQYPQIMSKLMNIEECTTPEEYIEIVEMLEKQSLEYLVPILLYRADINIVMDKVLSRLYAEGLTKNWEYMGTGQMLTDIKRKIREEMKLEELSKE